MPFRNPVVGGTTLKRQAIESPDFAAGVAGWRIARDGSVEFNSGTFRGDLEAATITGSTFRTADPPARRIEIDSDAAANEVRFYSGEPDEVGPGLIAIEGGWIGANDRERLRLSAPNVGNALAGIGSSVQIIGASDAQAGAALVFGDTVQISAADALELIASAGADLVLSTTNTPIRLMADLLSGDAVELTAFTPQITNAALAPIVTIGVGNALGYFLRIGDWCIVLASIVLTGATVTSAGAWFHPTPAPFTANPTFMLGTGIGIAAGSPYPLVARPATGSVILHRTDTRTQLSNTNPPWGFGAGESLRFGYLARCVP